MENAEQKILLLLKSNPVFKHLTDAELAEIIDISHYLHFEKDDLVFSQKQEALYLYVVASGTFSLQLPNNDQKTFRRGELFGEIAIVNRNMRTGSVRAAEAATALTICGQRLFNTDHVRSGTALKIVRALALKITNYLRSREEISTQELIQEGENEHVEFKSTLRWNIHTGKKDKAIEHASLKTITAFMNAEGGTLLVGVEDNQKILGLKHDQFENEDKLMLHLTKLINDKISPLHNRFINLSVEEIDNGQVLRVDCEAATVPAYLKNGNEEYFYVRTGPATTNLSLGKVYDYIQMRFGKKL